MKVNFYATLRKIAGSKTVEFALVPGNTVRHLVDLVVERYPAMRSELLNDDGELYGHVHVFVNGRDVPFLENVVDTAISVEDKIDIFPAVGGG
ncbi:MAG: MoaD/ThiS family protein [Chloroflexi bacterium]|nr:MoaD/ThiS family protein [Chloroflexota bacterium]